MRLNSGVSKVMCSYDAYADLSAVKASPPMKCSMRSMPIRIASRGFTLLRLPLSRWPVTVSPWKWARSMRARSWSALGLESLDAKRRPVIDLGVDLLRSDVPVPVGPCCAEVRSGVEQPRSGLGAILDPNAQLAHRGRVHLAGRERRC